MLRIVAEFSMKGCHDSTLFLKIIENDQRDFMKDIKKRLHITISVLSFLWCLFTVLHVIFTGKIYIWNLISSIPTLFFIIIPIVFLIYQILQKKKRLLFICVPILAFALGITQADINIIRPGHSDFPADTYKKVKVLDWNTNCWDQQKDREQFFKFLKTRNADIYILQEYLHGPVNLDDPSVDKTNLFSLCPPIPEFLPQYRSVDDLERLKQEFPEYYIATDNQFAIVSRFPIKNTNCDGSGEFSVSDIDIYGRTVRFFNVHMLLHLNPEDPLNSAELDKRYRARKLGFKNLRDQIKKSGMDYFISGDFNSTKAMGVMNGLLKENADAAEYSKDLVPSTFNFKGMKLWRFDYALVKKSNKNVSINSYKCLSNEGLSDHNPLFLTLSIKNP
jgi:hypothetical protein